MAVSKIDLSFTEYDDGSIYRCVASSNVIAAHEDKPQAQIKLSVQCKLTDTAPMPFLKMFLAGHETLDLF